MTLSTPVQPDSTTDQGNSYKAAIDAMFAGGVAIAQAFAPHEQSTPDMTVRLDAGVIHNVDTDARTAVAAQSTATITAPSTNPRNDIVYIDETTGAVGVAAGTEAASPSDPAIPTGKLPIAMIALTISTTTISNSILTDYRAAIPTGWLKPDGDGSSLTGITAGASETDMRLAFLMIAENAGDRLNMVDGIADPYMDETDVDTATSTNETYNAAGDYYENPGTTTTPSAAGEWTGDTSYYTFTGDDVINNTVGHAIKSVDTFTGDFTMTWSPNHTAINRLYVGCYAIAEDGTFTPGNEDGQVDTMTNSWWINYDRCMYGGTNKYTFTGSSSAVYKLERVSGTFKFYKDNVLQHTFADTSSTEVRLFVGAGTTDTAADFSWTAPGTPANMTLVSNAFTADSAPATGRIHIQVNPIDAITINTDLTAEISRDGGTTWTSGTLVLKETLADGTKAYEADSVTISGQPSGTSMKYQIKTLNNKEVQLHGAVLQWA